MPVIYNKKTIVLEEIAGFTCDKCKTKYDADVDIFETQEMHHIKFTGGYASVFGDMQPVDVVICQHCLFDIIGDIACS